MGDGLCHDVGFGDKRCRVGYRAIPDQLHHDADDTVFLRCFRNLAGGQAMNRLIDWLSEGDRAFVILTLAWFPALVLFVGIGIMGA